MHYHDRYFFFVPFVMNRCGYKERGKINALLLCITLFFGGVKYIHAIRAREFSSAVVVVELRVPGFRELAPPKFPTRAP
jgi:hypothetical protein